MRIRDRGSISTLGMVIDQSTWRTFVIRSATRRFEVYAPDLGTAFSLARVDGAGSDTLTCDGTE